VTGQFAEVTGGEFVRQPNHFTDRITADGSSGYPVEAGRYVLYVSLACPWAHRSVIVRRLLGLEDALALRVVDPLRDEQGWRFTLDDDGVDPVTGASYVMELYRRSDPAFEGRATVPFLWDTQTERIVSNDYPQITLDLSTEWAALHGPGAPDLYPEHSREAIDEMAEANFHAVNNGVYKAGFATSQERYEAAYDALFARLHELDELLGTERYLVGRQLSEADVRLYTTLVRFDAAYHGHFKCNERKLTEFAHLWPYARDLFQTPGFGDTTDFAHVKSHYYGTHDKINPTLVVPKGPDLSGWDVPHGRDHLGQDLLVLAEALSQDEPG
jgi:putative glutathione S-transferase